MIAKVPTLMIGLGGIGSEIVEKIEVKTQDKKSHYKKYIRDNIQFVIIDTDENSIRERRKGGYKGFSVSLSGDVSVGKCLEWDTDAKQNWFPNDNIFTLKSISEGAGQVRAVSRLAFQRAIRIGALTPLYEAIELLFRQSESYTNQELKIILVSTVAGGTGSGVFLPLAMYLKEYIKKTYSASGVKIDTCLILPEVLESLKSSSNERNNLYSNGYAALKEMSYFMHKTDNNIKNEKVYINLPNEENDELVTYKDSPFDFCFLFGKLTMRKRTLGTLEAYKDAVERCIYTQFIGAYSSKFFSIEDNMLISNINGSVHHEAGREIVLTRYASANCFKVFYPYERIEEYLSLYWGTDIMAKEWIKYDEEVRNFDEEQRKRREDGIKIIEYSDSEGFVYAVERLAERDNVTEEMVKQEKKNRNAEIFLSKFEIYIKQSIESELGLWRAIRDEKTHLGDKKQSLESLNQFFNYHAKLEEKMEEIKEKIEENIEYDVIKVHDDENDWKEYYIEYYFKKEKNGEWKSPNEIRYLLSKIVIELDKKQKENRMIVEKEGESFKEDKKALEDLQTSDDMKNLNKAFRNLRLKSKIAKKLDRICESMLNSSENLIQAQICENCFEKMKNHLEKILKKYQEYFQEYENTRFSFQRRMMELEKWFNTRVQGVDWLVYTSEECLEEMFQQMKRKKLYYQVGGQVSKWLYHYCDPKTKSGKFKNQDEEMKQMWKEMFIENYQKEFDINLFEAFAKEAACKEENIDENLYIINQLERAAVDFSAPLLTTCRKDTNILSAICIFSPELEKGMSFDAVKERYFRNARAVCDESYLDTDKRSIIFYQNRYGIESFMIDYVGVDTGENNSFPIGAGYKAYQTMLRKITGFEEKATLTPHIDNTWHRKEIMPDMDRTMEIEYTKWALKALAINLQDSEAISTKEINKKIWNMLDTKKEYKEGKCISKDKLEKFKQKVQIYYEDIEKENDSQEYITMLKKALEKALEEIDKEKIS